MKKGDKIRFHHYDKWDDTCGISQFNFEKEFSYDKIYIVNTVDDQGDDPLNAFGVVTDSEHYGFIHDIQHAYVVNEYKLPEDLFEL
jgi:hypothetical protein